MQIIFLFHLKSEEEHVIVYCAVGLFSVPQKNNWIMDQWSGPQKLRLDARNRISLAMLDCREYIPVEFQRKQRKPHKKFKTTELRTLIIYVAL